MHRPSLESPPVQVPRAVSPASLLFGTACCLLAALGYSAVNLCLREMAVRYDPMWILCMKETVTIAPLAPWLVYRALRRPGGFGERRCLGGLALVGLLTNTLASPLLIWAMGVVGLAIAVPVSLGVNLVATAALGRWLLGERVSRQSALAIGLLIASVVLLSSGANRANGAMADSALAAGPVWVVLAVVVACAAGAVYATLGVGIRRAATGGAPLGVIAFIVPAMGTLVLGPVCLWRHGLGGLLATAPEDALLMLGCGVLNLLAFLAIIKGLEITTLVHANVLTASQAAIAAVGGLLLFQEAASPALVVGVSLTVAGMVLIDRPASQAG